MPANDQVLPHGPYQECLEHSLAMAHLLEHAIMFLPQECELWHRSSAELMQYSQWIKYKLQPWN